MHPFSSALQMVRCGSVVYVPSMVFTVSENQLTGSLPRIGSGLLVFQGVYYQIQMPRGLQSPSPPTSGSSERGRCRRGRSEIPHFPSKLQSLALVPEEEAKNEEKRRKAKKNEKNEKAKKNEKKKKNEEKRENSSDPIYTNPIKNLPTTESRNPETPKVLGGPS